MAKKMTPEELKRQAKELLEKAKEAERKENEKIGAYIRKAAQGGFIAEYDDLKREILQLLGHSGLSTVNPKPDPKNNNELDDIA